MPHNPNIDDKFIKNLGLLLADVAATNNIAVGDIITISALIHDIFAGVLPPKKLTESISDTCGLDPKLVYKIVNTVKEGFLDKYKKELGEMYISQGGYFTDAKEQSPKPRETTPQLDGNIVNLRGQ